MDHQSLRNVYDRSRNRAAAPVGALVLALAAAGIIALIWLGTNLTERIYDNSGEKERFAELIQPVLMFDPPLFHDIIMLDNRVLLESALWAAMLGEKRETYTFDAQGNLLVPASDVDVAAARLFGAGIRLEHGSFPSDFGISYDYDGTTKTYRVPVAGVTALYTPRVDEIVRNGDEYELLVGYIPPGNAWTNAGAEDGEREPHKYMVYRMRKVDSHYQLLAIEEPPPEKQVRYTTVATEGQIASVDESLLGVEPEEEEAGTDADAPEAPQAENE